MHGPARFLSQPTNLPLRLARKCSDEALIDPYFTPYLQGHGVRPISAGQNRSTVLSNGPGFGVAIRRDR
jgi:hypothetical protein